METFVNDGGARNINKIILLDNVSFIEDQW